MAANRDRRATAGNRMTRVLEDEAEDDDFYKNTYGGFDEEEEDGDFASSQEDSADEVDSDFDNPEDQDERQEGEGDAELDKQQRKAQRGKKNKAYKEPVKRSIVAGAAAAAGNHPFKKPKLDPAVVKERTLSKESVGSGGGFDDDDGIVRKSSRHSTAKNSMMTEIRKKERETVDKKKKDAPKKSSTGLRRLTQEELLLEAEKTEKKNVKSLENYLRLEESRKKSLKMNRRCNLEGTATLKSLSLTMHGYTTADKAATVNTDSAAVVASATAVTTADEATAVADKRYSRHFYIFSDIHTIDENYSECMKTIRNPRSPPQCPVSGQPARYRDPLTNIPFYDVAALKEIRACYQQEMLAQQEEQKQQQQQQNHVVAVLQQPQQQRMEVS